MDESSAPGKGQTGKFEHRATFGMSSFNSRDQQQFGRNVLLAMACIEGKEEPANIKAMPDDESTLRQRLRTLTQEMSSSQADLLELLVRFDELEGWKSSGARHCAAWMNNEIGISLKLGWEYLRVGRKLRTLPTTRALFRVGKLSWSKIRLLVRVADVDNEKILCHAALDASVSDVARLCEAYHWKEDDKDQNDNERARRQWASRSLSWNETSNGSTRIYLTLPPEVAQAFLNSVEHSLKVLKDSELEAPESMSDDLEATISQQRADAAVFMAETSLQAAGREIATADRYQVIVSVEADDLRTTGIDVASTEISGSLVSGAVSTSNNVSPCATAAEQSIERPAERPAKRPTIRGAGIIARESARRIACDCSVTTNTTRNGEPTDIGRKSRIWPPAMARAIKNRDQHCQYNGCRQTKNLQIHHIVHWADGGSTSVSNGMCLCVSCHTKVHEGGYRIQKVNDNEQLVQAQFEQQQHAHDLSLFDVEKALRNDRESFDKVRALSPTRYRFRIVDAAGRDIRYHSDESISLSTDKSSRDYPGQSTRVDCAETAPATYGFERTTLSRRKPWGTAEQSATYDVHRFADFAHLHWH